MLLKSLAINLDTSNKNIISLIGKIRLINGVKNIKLYLNKNIFTINIKLFSKNIGKYKTALTKKSKLADIFE